MTSIEPTCWGVGSNVFALLGTYHQHGQQTHPTLAWPKELVEQVARTHDRRPHEQAAGERQVPCPVPGHRSSKAQG